MEWTNEQLIETARVVAKYESEKAAQLLNELATRLDCALAATRVACDQRNALAAENAGLKNQLRELFNSCDTGERRGNGSLSGAAVPDWCVLEKTRQFLESAPATDAFLAEVRASAVDEACLKISNAIVNCYQDEQVGLYAAATICGDFAAQLRKGVQS